MGGDVCINELKIRAFLRTIRDFLGTHGDGGYYNISDNSEIKELEDVFIVIKHMLVNMNDDIEGMYCEKHPSKLYNYDSVGSLNTGN